MQLLNESVCERESAFEFASYVNRIRIRCVCACVRVIGRLSDWRQIAPRRRLITVHNCSAHKSCGEMKFGQLVAPASTASDPKSAMLAVAPRHDGHELDARVTFATAWQVICLRTSLPPSFRLSLSLSLLLHSQLSHRPTRFAA